MRSTKTTPNRPTALSLVHPFVTVLNSDLSGPSRRQRLVLRGQPVPGWLESHMVTVRLGHHFVVAAMGRTCIGSSTRIRSIVVYPERLDSPEVAYVYVEEVDVGLRRVREAAPIHVVRCAPLPGRIHFVELPAISRSHGLPLKRI